MRESILLKSALIDNNGYRDASERWIRCEQRYIKYAEESEQPYERRIRKRRWDWS